MLPPSGTVLAREPELSGRSRRYYRNRPARRRRPLDPALAASYKPSPIIMAERVADEYLADFRRYQGRWVAMDALLRELA
nr:hypothetical protein [Methylobacterium sp. L1A1]